ncbi:exodeoxyribonuclease I [Methylophaga thiooxydans]|uniref:Exodeoxyribonuclease I n=1 Tax=Methylophaga thiooxydans DMS010 TaxID=637616 RepID=C0N6J4_9GAMM|nr:exodeoxyribonuclease I [Methylophaga thiooxydans]EEF79240.1 Exonuclease C-terminal domain family [Methylophaga thiooxydans DMS010]
MTTLYWHDYETSGIDPRFDRPMQFAGVRTDEDLNIIGEPLMIYCKPSGDYLPHPQAALVTGLTPQLAEKEGLNEAEFIKQIHDELAAPGTCGVGYNSLRFDDEFTRFTLFRNFYDAYAREWQSGNSRWDIIDMVRLTRALRPEGIHWPNREDGKPSFRLEDLTAANGIEHSGAHDALADVYATIEMARLIKNAQPKLYDYVFERRRKQTLAPLLNLNERKPVVHVSRMYPGEYCGTALVVPLAKDPNNNNGIIVYDLRHDPKDLIELDAETLRERLFTPTADLPEGATRPALKTLHINKCPVVVPENTLDDAAAERLQIDRTAHYQHLDMLNTAQGLTEKLNAIFTAPTYDEIDDPDASLYGGGFFSDNDKRKMDVIRNADPAMLPTLSVPFEDPRLPELLFRYRARNWPESLNQEEQEQWVLYRQHRLGNQAADKVLNVERFETALAESRQQDLNEEQKAVLEQLEQYAQRLKTELAL